MGLAAAAYRALWWEPRHVRLTVRALALPGWRDQLDGLRVAVIADLRTGAPHVSLSKLRRVVTRLNAQRPDLVALLGDYVDPRVTSATPIPIAAVAAALGRLRAPLGVVAVLGNRDWVEGGRQMASRCGSGRHGPRERRGKCRARALGCRRGRRGAPGGPQPPQLDVRPRQHAARSGWRGAGGRLARAPGACPRAGPQAWNGDRARRPPSA
jgi:Calcineurin-like phosphoesterase